jgi:hypothetical protein
MENGKKIAILLMMGLLFAMITASTAAQTRTPGVSTGDTFTYGNALFNWYSDDPSATQPVEWADLNQTAYFTASVESVVGTNVSCSLLLHFSNGTELADPGWVDVDTGDGENITLFLISANLGPGDPIYSTGEYATWTINETIPRNYAGGTRDTNHLSIAMDESIPPYVVFSLSWDIYWDKATGILAEMSMSSNQTYTYTTDMSFSVNLTGSSIWVVPEFVGLPQIVLLLASLAIVALVCRRKLNKIQYH